jgi:DNA-binding transcriptional MerR regulator
LQRITDELLERFERDHPQGISSQEILDTLVAHDIKFSEATLRKYVQLGLLPRSVRVGRKGKHQGSQGMYPAAVIRQIQRIRDMMAENFTIEEIQREFLFVRGDIEDLERSIAKVFDVLRDQASERRSETVGRAVTNDLAVAEQLANDLLAKLTVIEERLMAQAQLQRRVG